MAEPIGSSTVTAVVPVAAMVRVLIQELPHAADVPKEKMTGKNVERHQSFLWEKGKGANSRQEISTTFTETES